ncbi:unnamed protein product [Sphagnum compactum]
MPMDLTRDEAGGAASAAAAADAGRSGAASAVAAAAGDEVSQHHNNNNRKEEEAEDEEEKGMPGAKASWSFVSIPAASSVHPIEEIDDNDLPSFHINRLRRLPFRAAAAANKNGNLSKPNGKDLGVTELQRSSGSAVEQGVAINHTTAPEELGVDEQQRLQEVVETQGTTTVLATGSELSDGKLEAIMSVQPQEQETHFEEEPNDNLNPTRGSDASAPGNLHVLLLSEATDENSLITPLQTDGNWPQADILNQENVQANLEKDGAVRLMEPAIIQEDNLRFLERADESEGELSLGELPITFDGFHALPAEVPSTATKEAPEMPAAEALNLELSEMPRAATVIFANSQKEADMSATSRESAEGETAVATEIPATATSSAKVETDNVFLPYPQELEQQLPNDHDKLAIDDGKQGESVDNNEFPSGHYYTNTVHHSGDALNTVDPLDSSDRLSQGHDSPGSQAKTNTGSDGDSSRLHEKSVSDVDTYADLVPIPFSGPIGYSGPIPAAYSGSSSHPGAPNHSGQVPFSGSISYRSDSSAASNRSFAFPIFATEWNSSPVRMAQPDRRYLRHKRRWRPSCMCCSRPSPTYN